MICVICKHGEAEPGLTSVTLERGGLTLVVKRVPALVCPNCGKGRGGRRCAGVRSGVSEGRKR